MVNTILKEADLFCPNSVRINFTIYHYLTCNRWQAYFFAILYSFSHYRIIDGYSRFDIGEYMALTFVPLVLIGMEIILQKKDYSKWYWIAFGMAGILYSHILTAVILAALIVIRLFLSWYQIRKEMILALIKAAGLSFLLAMYQLVSIGEQMMNMRLFTVTKVDLIGHIQPFGEMIINALNDDPQSVTVGFLVIVILILALLGIKDNQSDQVQSIEPLVMGLILMIMTTTLFPWVLLNKTPVAIIQFPFRLTGVAGFYILLAGTIAVVNFKVVDRFTHKNLTVLVVICLTIVGMYVQTAHKIVSNANTYSQKMGMSNTQFRLEDFSFSPVDDYKPINSTKLDETISKKQFSINSKPYTNQIQLNAQKDSLSFDFIGRGTVDKIDIPVIDYKGVTIIENGKPLNTYRTKRGTVGVKLYGEKVHHHIIIQYKGSIIRKVSVVISVITGAVVIWIAGKRKTKR